ncbi:hypothetical protein NP493_1943g00005 [Ridgeia piscesae]|uniref:Uncharacterized protein n=1 Tax=Ridgeia piscesae TaxID=27915 RepID=A0AAD9N6J7_RIDPI|nr:hypothetical protein NP493_1943g00005 [Ridgeia piscesae]
MQELHHVHYGILSEKRRQPGQGTVAEQRGRDYCKELEEREWTAREKWERGGHTAGDKLTGALFQRPPLISAVKQLLRVDNLGSIQAAAIPASDDLTTPSVVTPSGSKKKHKKQEEVEETSHKKKHKKASTDCD